MAQRKKSLQCIKIDGFGFLIEWVISVSKKTHIILECFLENIENKACGHLLSGVYICK